MTCEIVRYKQRKVKSAFLKSKKRPVAPCKWTLKIAPQKGKHLTDNTEQNGLRRPIYIL